MDEQDKKLERLNVQLDAGTRKKLNDLSAVTGWSVAQLIRFCIDEGLEAVELKALSDPKVSAKITQARDRGTLAANMLKTAQSLVKSTKK